MPQPPSVNALQEMVGRSLRRRRPAGRGGPGQGRRRLLVHRRSVRARCTEVEGDMWQPGSSTRRSTGPAIQETGFCGEAGHRATAGHFGHGGGARVPPQFAAVGGSSGGDRGTGPGLTSPGPSWSSDGADHGPGGARCNPGTTRSRRETWAGRPRPFLPRGGRGGQPEGRRSHGLPAGRVPAAHNLTSHRLASGRRPSTLPAWIRWWPNWIDTSAARPGWAGTSMWPGGRWWWGM